MIMRRDQWQGKPGLVTGPVVTTEDLAEEPGGQPLLIGEASERAIGHG